MNRCGDKGCTTGNEPGGLQCEQPVIYRGLHI